MRESQALPKATVYPKFAGVAKLYLKLQAASEGLVKLRAWRARLEPFFDDLDFTPLPDASARAPVFDAAEVSAAREWAKGVAAESAAKSGAKSQARDSVSHSALGLASFRALDAAQLRDCDALFGGFDPVLAFSAGLARPGLCVSGDGPALSDLFGLVEVQRESLELSTEKARLSGSTGASSLAGRTAAVPSPRGYELVRFASEEARERFCGRPGVFCAFGLALSLAAPEWLPLVFLMDLPVVARVLNSVQMRPEREALCTAAGGLRWKLLPGSGSSTSESGVESGGVGAWNWCGGAFLGENGSSASGPEGLWGLAGPGQGRRFQVDAAGAGCAKEKAVELFGRFLLGRLGELEPAGDVLSAPYSVEGLLQPD